MSTIVRVAWVDMEGNIAGCSDQVHGEISSGRVFEHNFNGLSDHQ